MNGITRTIRFSQHKSLDRHFTEKTRNNFKRGPFVFLEELYSYSFVSRRKKKTYFFSLWFSGRKEPKYLSLVFQGENYHRESFHWEREIIKKKKAFFKYIFNSDSFWVVLKLPETAPHFLIYLGRVGWTHLGTQTQLQQLY